MRLTPAQEVAIDRAARNEFPPQAVDAGRKLSDHIREALRPSVERIEWKGDRFTWVWIDGVICRVEVAPAMWPDFT